MQTQPTTPEDALKFYQFLNNISPEKIKTKTIHNWLKENYIETIHGESWRIVRLLLPCDDSEKELLEAETETLNGVKGEGEHMIHIALQLGRKEPTDDEFNEYLETLPKHRIELLQQSQKSKPF